MGYFIKKTDDITFDSTRGTQGAVIYQNNALDTVELAKSGSASPVIDTLPSSTATVSAPFTVDHTYSITALGSTDFTLIGSNELIDGTDPFVIGTEYIISYVVSVDTITLGGTNNSIGYADNDPLTISVPDISGGVQATGTTTVAAVDAVGALVQGTTTFTSRTGLEVNEVATYTLVSQSATSGTGSGAVFTIAKAGGTTDYSDLTITVTTPGIGYNTTETITIDGADIGGVTITNDLTFTISTSVGVGEISGVTITEAGSGYTSAPTVSADTGTQGTLTLTAALTAGTASDFAAIGATIIAVGEIFTATGTAAAGTDTAVETIFTATGVGAGTGTAIDLTYTMTVDYTAAPYDVNPPANPEDLILVSIQGIYQEAGTAYTVLAGTITFTSIPPNDMTITIIHGAYSTFVPDTNIF